MNEEMTKDLKELKSAKFTAFVAGFSCVGIIIMSTITFTMNISLADVIFNSLLIIMMLIFAFIFINNYIKLLIKTSINDFKAR